MTCTLDFLISILVADGSFDEIDARSMQSPHMWLKVDTCIDRFFFTTAVLMRLISLGYRKHPVIDLTIGWKDDFESL